SSRTCGLYTLSLHDALPICSPKDKYIVRDDITRDTVWWSDQGKNDNKPMSQETWSELQALVGQQLSGKRLFVVDTFCGANPDTRSEEHTSELQSRFDLVCHL